MAPTVPTHARTIVSQKDISSAVLRVHFPSTTLKTPGTHLSKAESKEPPTFSLSRRIANSPTSHYTIIELDLDAPHPSFSFASPILHFFESELSIPADAQTDEDGFVKLVSKEGTHPAAFYGAPNPPGFSPSHRYVFLVFEQPEGLTNGEVRKRLGFAEKVGIWGRVRWDGVGSEKKVGLGECLGGNWFATP